MAGSFIPFRAELGSYIADLRRKAEALATTPMAGNQSIKDGALAVLNASNLAEATFGQYRWPTPPWEDNVIYGMVTFDGAGHPIVVAGLQPDGLYGLGIYNGSGEREVLLGQQSTGIYGLGVRNQDGDLQQVAGALESDGANVIGCTSTSPVTTTASITAILGPSGQALVTIGAGINTTTTPGTAQLYVDGSAAPGHSAITAGTGIIASVQSTFLVAPGSGSHTFDIRVFNPGPGGSTNFTGITLVVQPM
jgi:hypothetical protein